MTTLYVGSNRFVDCQTLVAFGGTPLLSVTDQPLRVALATPAENPSGRQVLVDTASPPSTGPVHVVVNPDFVGVYWDTQALVLASRVSPGSVHVFVDLRPVGMAIYVDPPDLRVGDTTFTGNTFSAPTAISIGVPSSRPAAAE